MSRKVITMKELEMFMKKREGKVFDASSVDSYTFSVDMLCTGYHFDKVMNTEDEYLLMTLTNEPTEIDIDVEIIEDIYLDEDKTVTIEFNNGLPDLEIKYRE